MKDRYIGGFIAGKYAQRGTTADQGIAAQCRFPCVQADVVAFSKLLPMELSGMLRIRYIKNTESVAHTEAGIAVIYGVFETTPMLTGYCIQNPIPDENAVSPSLQGSGLHPG